MEENKRMLILAGVVLVIVGIILLISFWPKQDKTFACKVKKEDGYTNLASITYDDYKCLKDEDEVIIAVGDFDKKEKSALNKAGKNAGKGIYYVGEDISKSDLKTIKKQLKYNDNSFEKDVLLVVKKGKVKEYKEDVFNSSSDITAFFEEAGVAKFSCGVNASDEFENLAIIDYDDYKCLYDSDKTFVIVVAQTTCSHCINFEPVINEYAGENNIPVYVINVDQLESDDFNNLTNSVSYFSENENWGTPLTLAIKDKQVIASISGEAEESAIESLMKEAGLK